MFGAGERRRVRVVALASGRGCVFMGSHPTLRLRRFTQQWLDITQASKKEVYFEALLALGLFHAEWGEFSREVLFLRN